MVMCRQFPSFEALWVKTSSLQDLAWSGLLWWLDIVEVFGGVIVFGGLVSFALVLAWLNKPRINCLGCSGLPGWESRGPSSIHTSSPLTTSPPPHSPTTYHYHFEAHLAL